jgi:hypothetical protein
MRNNGNNGYGAVRSVRTGRAAPFKRTVPQPVWLEYNDGQARNVSIVGSFNNWNTSSTGMVRVRGGRWLRVLFLAPGRYEYLFVVDGRCVADPRAAESVPNVYGCVNSVLCVPACAPRNGWKPVKLQSALTKAVSRLCRKTNAPRLENHLNHPALQTIA